MRKIIHCDCDSFYASVETRDDPSLIGVPLAVGGRPDKRGVVATCNYEARKFGVHSALPTSQAIRLCPDLVVLPPDMNKYRKVSQQIHTIFEQYTDLIEPLSLDEAFLDVSDTQIAAGSATRMAELIRDQVHRTVGITISAGIAPNKFLAKIASDWNKPNGQLTITPDEVATFVATLPVEKLFGVGSVTAASMHRLGLKTCGDVQKQTLLELTHRFGKFGARLFELSRGVDDRQVQPDRLRKSVSVERTYAADLPDLAACQAALTELLPLLDERIDRAQVTNRIDQCFMKVRFAGFETTTASQMVSQHGAFLSTSSTSSSSAESSTETATFAATYKEMFTELLHTAWPRGARPVRLLGIGVRLAHPAVDRQLSLFE